MKNLYMPGITEWVINMFTQKRHDTAKNTNKTASLSGLMLVYGWNMEKDLSDKYT